MNAIIDKRDTPGHPGHLLQEPGKRLRTLSRHRLAGWRLGVWAGLAVSLFALGTPKARAQLATLLCSEDFETNGWNGWTNDTQYTLYTNYAWVIGMPTNGPGAAHHGTNCAMTYLSGTDCYLDSPPLYLPPANQYSNHLWLYYWQWQIYTNTATNTCLSDVRIRQYQPFLGAWGPWNTIDPGTSGLIVSRQPCWRRRGIDLTLFSGGVVQLGFKHAGTGDPGWFVDDLEIWDVPVLSNVPALQGFESGWGCWFNDRLCEWDIGTPTGTGPTNVPEGLRCAGTALEGIPPAVADGHVWTPAFYMPSVNPGERVYLQFDQWWDFAFGGMAKIDWTYWFPSIGWWYPENLTPNLATSAPRTWAPVAVDVTALAGTPEPIRLGFGYYGTSGLGWFIDRVQFTIARCRISSIVRQGNDINLAWTAPAGTTNVVQCSGAVAGPFTNLSAPLIAPGAAQVTLSYTNVGAAAGAATRFYRVRQL